MPTYGKSTFSYGPDFLFIRDNDLPGKKKFHSEKTGELLKLLKVLTLVTGISNPHGRYNWNWFSNFLFTYLEALYLVFKK